MISVWLYDQVPGTHTSWRVAMYAISQVDADRAMRAQFGGGRRVMQWQASMGKIKADCGAASDAAQAAMAAQMSR